jgi:hypothetical protein
MIGPSRTLRLAAAAFVVSAGVLLAGCGGGSVVSTPLATPTPAGQFFTFASAGGTANISPGASGSGTLTSGTAVGGVSISSTWGANNATTTVAMTAQVATGNGDITSSTSTVFPLFTVATAVTGSGAALTGSYTVVDYLKVTATPVTSFTQTPGIVVTVGAPASLTGKTTCSYFSLGGSVTAPQWSQGPTAAPSGSTITFAPQSLGNGNTIQIGNGSTNVAYLALACM